MNLTLLAAINYLQKFAFGENDSLRVVITQDQHDEVLAAMRKARRPTKWVELDLRDESLKPLFEEFARADVRINLWEEFPEFPEEPGAKSNWYISVFSKFLGVTTCFPMPTQELFDLYCKKSQGLIWRKIDQDAPKAPVGAPAPPPAPSGHCKPVARLKSGQF